MAGKGKPWLLPLVVAVLSLCANAQKEAYNGGLIERATRIAAVNLDRLSYPPYYAWLSNEDILFVRWSGRRQITFFQWNVTKGKEKYLKAMTDVLWDQDATPMTATLSPDGQWLLWSALEVDAVTIQAVRPNGSGHLRWGAGGVNRMYWMSDDRHWVVFGAQGDLRNHKCSYALVRSLDEPDHLVRKALPAECQFDTFCRAAFTRQDHLLIETWGERKGLIANVDILECIFGDTIQLVNRYTVHLPPDVEIDSLTFSPHGDRIAWVFRTTVLGERRRGLWISRADGSQMHEIGRVEIPQRGRPAPLGFIEWTPDGERVSFIYKNTLYTVPAESTTKAE